MFFLLEPRFWQEAGISTLAGCSSSCFGAVPDWLVTAISCHQLNPLSCIFFSNLSNCLFLCWFMVHRSAFPSCLLITDSFCLPCRSSSFVSCSTLPIALLLYLFVSFNIHNISIVKMSGPKTSEGWKACQLHTEIYLKDICLFAAQTIA